MIEEIHHEDEILGKAYDARLMARILRYLRPYWKLLTVSFIFLLLQTGGQLLGPYITKVAIDRYIAERDVHGLDVMALAYLGVVFSVSSYCSSKLMSRNTPASAPCMTCAWKSFPTCKSRTWLTSTATRSGGS